MLRLLSFISVLSLLISCGGPDEYIVTLQGNTQGTTYKILYVVDQPIRYNEAVDSILFAVDRSMSAWNPHSTLSKVNRGMDSLLDPLFQQVIKRGLQVSQMTNGAFDMTVAPLVNAWGFGSMEKADVDSAYVDSLLGISGYKRLHLLSSGRLHRPDGMQIDVNAIAQGYSVDLVADYLESKGINNYLIEIGGEMRANGTKFGNNSWVVGIDKPMETIQEERFQITLNLDTMSLATSGNYRKFIVDEETGIKYSHTIDPHTGYPVSDRLLSATILSPDCMTADAVATACMVMGLDNAKVWVQEQPEFEAYFIYSDLTGDLQEWWTPGFEKRKR
ncbi:MAG: FAD:protein FMN transferase [Flavobacteriia bacterium]|nr:FAD:protein FMN transferase [Flavobacteriia bacterium]